MNNKQFAKVLRVAMKYYDPTSIEKERYMCLAISRAAGCGELSEWQHDKANTKINKLIRPWSLLSTYLRLKLGRPPTGEELIRFWDQFL